MESNCPARSVALLSILLWSLRHAHDVWRRDCIETSESLCSKKLSAVCPHEPKLKRKGRGKEKNAHTFHGSVSQVKLQHQKAQPSAYLNHHNGFKSCKAELTFAIELSGKVPFHLSSTLAILSPSVWINTLLSITCSLLMPLTTYLAFMSISIGLPALVTS